MNWKNIIAKLIETGMTQVEIAHSVGCGQATISELARGETRDPRSSVGLNLIGLANARGIDAAIPRPVVEVAKAV